MDDALVEVGGEEARLMVAQFLGQSMGFLKEIDKNINSSIHLEESNDLLKKLNKRLGKKYSNDQLELIKSYLQPNAENKIEIKEFRNVFEKLMLN